LELAFAEQQIVAELEAVRHAMQRVLAHEIGAQARQVAFTQAREAGEKLGGDHAVQHAVAEELQPFVVRNAVAPMRDRLLQQTAGVELVPQGAFEQVQLGLHYSAELPEKSIRTLIWPKRWTLRS